MVEVVVTFQTHISLTREKQTDDSDRTRLEDYKLYLSTLELPTASARVGPGGEAAIVQPSHRCRRTAVELSQ